MVSSAEGSQPPSGAGMDWLGYAATVQELLPAELETEYRSVLAQLAPGMDAESSIKLALLVAAPRRLRPDLERAAELLSSIATDPSATGNDIEFASLMHGIVTRLASQRAALDAELAIRRSLEEQLAALKALETRLNADESER